MENRVILFYLGNIYKISGFSRQRRKTINNRAFRLILENALSADAYNNLKVCRIWYERQLECAKHFADIRVSLPFTFPNENFT
jgi:hypothetical protein